MTLVPRIVAIDGPAGAGKSTIAKLLAERLGFSLVDTGAIYRCTALLARRQATALNDDVQLERIIDSLRIEFRMVADTNRVFLGTAKEDVTEQIRTPENSMAASEVSARARVRARLLDVQRRLAAGAASGAVVEGRDIGTVVFPDAPHKFFLMASPQTRAQRRYDELSKQGVVTSLSDVLADQVARDKADSERTIAPLVPAADAIIVDSTGRTIDDVISEIARAIGMPSGR